MDAEFDLTALNTPHPKCKLCGKVKGLHKAVTLECPIGMKTRIGYTSFGLTVYQEKTRAKS